MANLGKRAGLKFIYGMRQIFANTPVQKWKLTAYLYPKFFHILYGKKDVQASYKGIEMILPTKDVTIVPSILGGYFESLEIDVFKALMPKTSTVIDVGGNIGLYAILAGQLNPTAKIASFEPIEENIQYFNKNLKLNKVKNVTIVNSAVGATTGELEIFLSATNVGTHSAAQQVTLSSNSVMVPMVSIDDYVKKFKLKPDVIKVDVEGYDGFVFDGSIDTLKKYRPTVFAEYGPAMMKKCRYEPAKFLDILFDNCDEAYLFEEKTGKLKKVEKIELLNKSISIVDNIVLVSNKDHKKIIREFAE